MALKHFIVCMRDTHLRLIGPFETREDMRKYGRTQTPADDPRWQSIELDTAHIVDDGAYISGVDTPQAYRVGVYAPSDGPMPD